MVVTVLVLYLGAMTGGGLWSLAANERRVCPPILSRTFWELVLRWYLGAFYMILLIFPGCVLNFIELLPRAFLCCFGRDITGPTYVGEFYDRINPLLNSDLDRLWPVNQIVLEKEKRQQLYNRIYLIEQQEEDKHEKEKARLALVEHMMKNMNAFNHRMQWVAIADHPDDSTDKIVLDKTAASTKLACKQKINNLHLTKQQHQSLFILPIPHI